MAKTGAEGLRMKEGASINKSLLTLGTVINKLSEGVQVQGAPSYPLLPAFDNVPLTCQQYRFDVLEPHPSVSSCCQSYCLQFLPAIGIPLQSFATLYNCRWSQKNHLSIKTCDCIFSEFQFFSSYKNKKRALKRFMGTPACKSCFSGSVESRGAFRFLSGSVWRPCRRPHPVS